MALGDIADYLIGLVVERIWPQASLLIFLLLYFVFLWVAWLLAVKLTEPKPGRPHAEARALAIPLKSQASPVLPARPAFCAALSRVHATAGPPGGAGACAKR